MKRFSTILKKLRNKKQISQSELAKRSKLTSGCISQLESGTREPTYTTMIKIAKGLEICPSQFFGGKKMKKEIMVLVAENSRNGLPIGRVTAFEFADEVISLECNNTEGENFSTTETYFSVFGNNYSYNSDIAHVGNLYWNAYNLPIEEAVRLLNDILKSENFSAAAGYENFYEKFETGQEFEINDFKEV